MTSGSAGSYSETEYPRVAGWSPLQALTDGRWMAIRAGAATELYDLQSDPQQQRDVSRAQPAVAAAMAARAALDSRQRGDVGGAGIRPTPRSGCARSATSPAPAASAGPGAQIPPRRLRRGTSSRMRSPRSAPVAPTRDACSKRSRRQPRRAGVSGDLRARPEGAGQLRAALAVYRRALRRWPTDATLLHDLAVTARDAADARPGAAARALREEATRAEQAALAARSERAQRRTTASACSPSTGPRSRRGEGVRAGGRDRLEQRLYWANLGNARRALGDRTGAEHAYRKALDVDARAADAANGLGVLLVEAKRPADAAPWFERAIAAAPDSSRRG